MRFAYSHISWGQLLRRTWAEILDDDVMSLAAQQAYYFFFSLFPALLTLIAVASFFLVEDEITRVVGRLGGVVPGDVLDIITGQLRSIANGDHGGVLTFAFLVTIWSSSGAMLSMITTLNTAYDYRETRAWWRMRLIAIGLTIALAVFVVVAIALVLFGPTVAERLARSLRLGQVFEWSWKILQWPVVFGLVSLAIALVYHFAPNGRQRWTWLSPGALLATGLWLLVSLGLKFYLASVGGYNETYGALGGVMVLLLWFYASSVAILIGAELNSEIEHSHTDAAAAPARGPGPGSFTRGPAVSKEPS